MDKRWIIILLILIVGLGCMSYIVMTSTTVGHAVTIVDDLSVTLPHGFKIDHSETGQTTLLDDRTNEIIFIKHIREGNKALIEYLKEIKILKENENVEILKNTSNKTIHTICYKDLNKDKDYTLYYLEKYNCTVLIKMENFKNPEDEQKSLDYMLETIKPDYKQSRA